MTGTVAQARSTPNRTRWIALATITGGLVPLAPVTRLPAQTAPLPIEAITATLDRLDAAFDRGDTAAWLAGFAPDNPAAHGACAERLANLFANGANRCRTTIVHPPQQVGSRTVALVRHDIRIGTDGALQEHSYVVFRAAAPDHAGGPLAAQPTLHVYVADAAAGKPMDCGLGRQFRCPPCSFQIGGVDGWLGVPLRADRAQALDAVTFYLLGTDIACDLSVAVDERVRGAARAVDDVVRHLRERWPQGTTGMTEPWSPPGMPTAAEAGAQATAARGALRCADGNTVIVHVVAIGPLQHVLLLRGSAASLERHHAAVQQLLCSYQIIDAKVGTDGAGNRSIRAHCGGELSDAGFAHERLGLRCRGPGGWQARLCASGFVFRVLWTWPAERAPMGPAAGEEAAAAMPPRGKLWCTALQPPTGVLRWTEACADRWFEDFCQRNELTPLDAPTPWSDDPASGMRWRLIECSATPARPIGPRQRLFRLHVRDDLLVVFDGYVLPGHDDRELRAAMRSLRRS